MKVYGFNIGFGDTGAVLSKSSTRVWADDVCGATRWGFFIRLVFGEWLRPIKKPWGTKGNVWTGGDHWFVLRSYIPLPGFLFSFFFGSRHAYVGTKTYGVDWPEYEVWLNPKRIKDGNQALAPSLSLRGW